MYQQQQLITDPVNILVPPIQIVMGQPHFLPNIQVPGPMQGIYPYIVTILMNELQSKAANNNARVYAFNLMAQNGFQTKDFMDICSLFVDLVDAVMRASNGQETLEQVITSLAPHFVGVYCLALTQYFPQLLDYLDPQTRNNVPVALTEMQRFTNLIRGGQQNNGYQQFGPRGQLQGHFPATGAGYQGYQPGRQFEAATAGGTGRGANDLFSTSRAQNATPTSSDAFRHEGGGGENRFEAQLRRQREAAGQFNRGTTNEPTATYRPVATTAPAAPAELPRTIAKVPFAMPKIVQHSDQTNQLLTDIQAKPSTEVISFRSTTEQEQAPAVPAPAPTPVVKKELVWKPSEVQPYRILFDYTKFVPGQRQVGSDVLTVVRPITKEELTNMDFNAHGISRAPVPRYDEVDSAPLDEPITDTTPEVPTFALEFSPDMILEMSTGITRVVTGIHYRLATAGKDRAAAHCFPILMAEPVAIESEETIARYKEIVHNLRVCGSFDAAQRILDELFDKPDDRRFFNRLNRLLTDELNLVLDMTGSQAVLDSFFEDVQSLFDFSREEDGPTIARALEEGQDRFFRELISGLDPKQVDEQTEFLLEEYIRAPEKNPENWKAGIAIMPWETSITQLSIGSWELNINLKKGQTGVLSEATTPELWSLADQILNNEKMEGSRRHYIVTNDGVMMLLTRGYIKKDAYLVRLIPEIV